MYILIILSVCLRVGHNKIPTDFVTVTQVKRLHVGWYKETKGCPTPLQAAHMGASWARTDRLGSLHLFFSEVSCRMDQCSYGKI